MFCPGDFIRLDSAVGEKVQLIVEARTLETQKL